MPRKNEGRVKVTHSLDKKTVEMLDEYSKQSDAPMGRIIDRAVAEYLVDKLEKKEC